MQQALSNRLSNSSAVASEDSSPARIHSESVNPNNKTYRGKCDKKAYSIVKNLLLR